MGRPIKNDRRQIVNAILYVTATGCQWRALPARYPNWNTVHHYRLAWARDGTLECIAERLAEPSSDVGDVPPVTVAPSSTRDSVVGDRGRVRMSRPARTTMPAPTASRRDDGARAGSGADDAARGRDPRA